MTDTLAKPKGRPLPIIALAAFVGVFVLYAGACVLSGGSAAGVLLYPLAFLLLVCLPGLWLARLTLPAAGTGVRWVASLPLGAVALMLVFTALGALLPAWACCLPSAAAGVCYLIKEKKRLRLPKINEMPLGACLMLLLFSAALFLFVFSGVFPYARTANAGARVYSQDLLWSIGNAAGARYGVPVRDLRTAGGVLHYHYFSDVLDGLVGLFAGQNAWDSVAYFCWPIWAAGLAAALYLLCRGFGAGPAASLLAPFGVFFAHTTWETGYWHIFTNMNGVVQSNFFLAAALLILQQAEKDGFKDKRALGALVPALGALIWGKSTIGVLLVCALLAAFLVSWPLGKKPNRWLAAAALAGAVVFGLLWFFIYRHAINNLMFAPKLSQLRDAFIILWDRCKPALLLYALSLVISLAQFKKLGATALAVNALVPGGILAYTLFHHYSFSQSYFLLAAVFAMWLCIGRVAGPMFTKKAAAGAALVLCGLSLASTLVYAAPTLRTGVQSALRCLHLRPDMPLGAESVTRDDDAAAAWLRENLARDEVFATNRNARNPAAADGIFHYYTAASERQAYVEGWRYAMDYSLEYHSLRHNLEQVSDGIFAAQSFEQAAGLARENGIDCLVVHLPSGGRPFGGETADFESETVLIYRVPKL